MKPKHTRSQTTFPLLASAGILWLFASHGASAERGRLQPGLPEGTLSRSFEMRLFTNDPKADGETDFRGPTEFMDVEGRVAFLRQYADYAKAFFQDPELNTPAATDEETMEVWQTIKPQPLPSVRRVMPLTEWKFLGFREGQDQAEQLRLEEWNEQFGTSIQNGKLMLTEDGIRIEREFDPLTWRFNLSWTASVPSTDTESFFELIDHQIDNAQLEVAVVGFNDEGRFFYRTDGEDVAVGPYEPNREYRFKLEVDLDPGSQRFNFYIDDTLVADFVVLADGPDVVEGMNRFYINGGTGMTVSNIFGQAFDLTAAQRRTGIERTPFTMHTFIDETFAARPSPEGFENKDYRDEAWQMVPNWPYAHGGERFKGERLFLRKMLRVEPFEKAVLKLDGSRPSGRLYINGQHVTDLSIYPQEVDVTEFLNADDDNLMAIVVNPRLSGSGEERLEMGDSTESTNRLFHHSNADLWTGWYAGLIDLHLTTNTRIDDVFTHATDIGDPATMHIDMRLVHDRPFDGSLFVEFFPWHPQTSDQAAATARFPVNLSGKGTETISGQIQIPDPALWAPGNPNLYKVKVTLKDGADQAIDDAVLTTGIRTVCQTGAQFRINGQPDMLNGPLIFQNLHPVEDKARWTFCPPDEWIVKQLLMIRNQGANAARMTVHDAPAGGYNDVRWARIADQLGIMLLWQTTAWIREVNLAHLHLEGLVLDVAARRNHPSIVMWQPANHAGRATMADYERVFTTIHDIDPSRLINPNAHMLWRALRRTPQKPDGDTTYPFWSHPMLARGTMEQTTGYSKNWRELRHLPELNNGELRISFLNSTTHAWFDFENEESIGQPNWAAHRGKPTYRIHSYERDYDRGTIGRVLSFDEWEEHQAYQAFSAYEAYRKKRWLGYDGLNWCSLRGGPNSGTYMKPMVDFYDWAKLSYYTVGMAFQRILAGSRNVDTVYGPGDAIPVMVLNMGPEVTVHVHIVARAADGSIVDRTSYENVKLPAGRGVTDLQEWKPTLPEQGIYAFEYTVTSAQD